MTNPDRSHPTVEEVCAALDHRLDSVVGGNEIELQRAYGLEKLVPVYVDALSRIRNSHGRIYILYWLQRYARTNERVVRAAVDALNDRSAMARQHACGALAYSGRTEFIPALQQLLAHSSALTRSDAAAAIDAIENRNHHLFMDRQHRGNVFWILNDEDEPAV